MAAAAGHANAKQNLEPMKMEAELAVTEHAIWVARGINKAIGLIKYDLAHGYLSDLKSLVSDPEVRKGLSTYASQNIIGLSKYNEVNQAIDLIYNISSSTPLSIEKVLYCAIEDEWELFDEMPKD